MADEDPSVRLLRHLYRDAAELELDDDDAGPPGPEAHRLAAFARGLIGGLEAAVAAADGDEADRARVAALTRDELLAELAAKRAARGESFDEAAHADVSDEDLRRSVRVLKHLPRRR